MRKHAGKIAFQSTLPVRGATGAHGKPNLLKGLFQSTLPVRGATHRSRQAVWRDVFQSTLPVRGATLSVAIDKLWKEISIHAPREGSDVFEAVGFERFHDFNPRSP